MDSDIAWWQPEQRGPAQEQWAEIALRAKTRLGKEANGRRGPANATSDSDSDSAGSPGRSAKRELNRASTTGDGELETLTTGHGGLPWIKEGTVYGDGVLGLHQEIMDFWRWTAATEHETAVRRDVFDSIASTITGLWPAAQVDFFGSFRTGLFLPTSDIDVVVVGEWEGFPLWTLEAALRDKGLAVPGSIKVLDKASVPIIKLTHRETEIRVDISFNMQNGVPSAQLITRFMEQYPVLKPLVYVLKYFLLQRDLNEVFTGGLSSYSLILMTISFLQLHAGRRCDVSSGLNMGVLLTEFFELYGRHFNYLATAIRVKGTGSYVPKAEIQADLNNGHGTSMLCIEDPLLPGNDIGRSCHGAMRVRQAFEYAFCTLQRALIRPSDMYTAQPSRSILSRIIRVTDDVVDYRAFLAGLPVRSRERSPSLSTSPVPPPPVSYAAVVSSHRAAVPAPNRPNPTSALNSCSEISDSDSESTSSSEASGDSGASRRSYSSVASSNLARPPASLPAVFSGATRRRAMGMGGRPSASTASNISASMTVGGSSEGPTAELVGPSQPPVVEALSSGGEARSSRRRRPSPRSKPPSPAPSKPPSPAPSTDSAASTGHRNAYRRGQRQRQRLQPSPNKPKHLSKS